MLTTYFKRPSTQAAYYENPVGTYLDDFAGWLEQRGYQPLTIRHRLYGAAEFGYWLAGVGYQMSTLPADVLDRYRDHLANHHQLHKDAGPHTNRWLGATLFAVFLQDQAILVAPPAAVPMRPALLEAFEHWMYQHRGIKASTLHTYRGHVVDLLSAINNTPTALNADQLREFLLAYAKHQGIEAVKTRVKALRTFLRFLVATNHCQPGLEAAIPAVAHARLSSLPRYLLPNEVERVLAEYPDRKPSHRRNRAILLCLARLGLRASEVAALRLPAIDWVQGTLRVMGKNRYEARLPLPQDVGEAILRYLTTARPAVDNDYVFLTAIAPWVPITRYIVKAVAGQAIRRAGIAAPSFGAHVFRHSAATGWLRQGASLQVIGEVLRHRDTDTTAHYAKVDTDLLGDVVRPWPGEYPC